MMAISLSVSLLIFVVAVYYFRGAEKNFADVI
jgi:hypothetical protein